MLELGSMLDFQLLDEEIEKRAEERIKNYRDQLEKTKKSIISQKDTKKYEDVSKALEETIEKSPEKPKDWWSWYRLAEKESDTDKKENIYKDALKQLPKSVELLGSYANLLFTVRKEYDKAEKLYRKALELDPNHANTYANYSGLLLLHDRFKESKK